MIFKWVNIMQPCKTGIMLHFMDSRAPLCVLLVTQRAKCNCGFFFNQVGLLGLNRGIVTGL